MSNKAQKNEARKFLLGRKRNLVKLKTDAKAEIRRLKHIAKDYEPLREQILAEMKAKLKALDADHKDKAVFIATQERKLFHIEDQLATVKHDLSMLGDRNKKLALLKAYKTKAEKLRKKINE